MKILWVKAGKLLPLDTGGKLRSYHILLHLSATHDVTFLSYYAGRQDKDYEREIARQLPGAFAVPDAIREVKASRRHLDYLRRLPTRVPYAVSQFNSPRVRRTLEEWMAQRRFDIAVCDFLACTQTFPRSLTTPSMLFQHNVESVLWKRRSRFAATRKERIVAGIECAKMARYEPAQVRRFHHVLAVSEQDRQAMRNMVDSSHISVIPTGVDLQNYRFDPDLRPAGNLVVFCGSMDWEPNIDGVEYFSRQIWPMILAAVPDARFRIVGRKPDSRVEQLASSSIEVTGTVHSVIDHLREAAVLVVPLRMGGGTRIKIFEGMALGKATVSTPTGAEGLDVHHERDIFLAQDPRRFAEYVVALLRDQALRRRFELAAAEAVRGYDWSVIARRFVNEAEKTIESAFQRRPDFRPLWPNLTDLRARRG